MNNQFIVTTGPASEPITLTEAKAQCRIESSFTDDDAWLNTAITVAREQAEGLLNRALINQTITMVSEGFPTMFEIPQPPLASVTSIKYYDVDNVQQTLAADQYQVNTYVEPGLVLKASSVAWPTVYSTRFDAVEIIFQAGWAAAANVPTSIKQGMLMLLTDLYDNRSQVDDTGKSVLRKSALSLFSLNRTQNYVG